MHTRVEAQILRHIVLARQLARRKHRGVIIGIKFRSEKRERQYVDAVRIFEHIKVIVLDTVFYGRRNAHFAACRRTHPQYVVITPLYVDVMVSH